MGRRGIDMCDNFYLVVGNIYKEFSCNENVFTSTEFINLLRNDGRWSGTERVVIGQGVHETERSIILSLLKRKGIYEIETFNHLAPKVVTHKKHDANVLITDPMRVGNKCYEFGLVIDNQFDRLLDHTTGQHLAGMLLIESGRQAMIATLEYEYQSKNENKIGLILEKFNTNFVGYAFPVPAKLVAKVAEKENSGVHLCVLVSVDVFQTGKLICEMKLELTLKEEEKLRRIENRQAKKVIKCLSGSDSHENQYEVEVA